GERGFDRVVIRRGGLGHRSAARAATWVERQAAIEASTATRSPVAARQAVAALPCAVFSAVLRLPAIALADGLGDGGAGGAPEATMDGPAVVAPGEIDGFTAPISPARAIACCRCSSRSWPRAAASAGLSVMAWS